MALKIVIAKATEIPIHKIHLEPIESEFILFNFNIINILIGVDKIILVR
jgi:hypothetical protein